MNSLDAPRGILTAIGYSLIPWSVIFLIGISWYNWGP